MWYYSKFKFISNNVKQGGYIGDALLEAGVKSLYQLFTLGLSQAIKSDTSKRMIKSMDDKYINQGINSLTNDLSNKLKPKICSGVEDHNAILKVAPKKGLVMPLRP